MVQKASLSLLLSLSLQCCLTRENQCRLCATCVKFMQSGVDAAGDKWPAADSINNFINALKKLRCPKKFHYCFKSLNALKHLDIQKKTLQIFVHLQWSFFTKQSICEGHAVNTNECKPNIERKVSIKDRFLEFRKLTYKRCVLHFVIFICSFIYH